MNFLRRLLASRDTLYHLTYLKHAVNIIKTNTFEMRAPEGNYVELQFGRLNYLSTARSRNSDYIRNGVGRSSALFVLDGFKLNQKYKVEPVSYWQGSYTDRDEEEERVFSSKPKIPAIPYIKRVYAVAPSKIDANWIASARTLLYRECKKKKIELLFVKDSRDLLKPKIPTIDYKPDSKVIPVKDTWLGYPRDSILRAFLTLYKIDPKYINKLQPVAREVKDKLDTYDIQVTFNREISNAQHERYGNSKKTRETLDELVKIMRKNKLSESEFIDYLRQKFKD